MDILIRREVIDETVGPTPLERVELLQEWSEDAAKVIADLRAENATLMAEAAVISAALRPFADFARSKAFDALDDDWPVVKLSHIKPISAKAFRAALAALTTSQEGDT